MNRVLTIAGLSVYATGAALNLVLDTAQGVAFWSFANHIALPATFFAFGATAKREHLPWFFAGNGLVALATAAWITSTDAVSQFYDPVNGAWYDTGNRVWSHPLTGEAIRATGINSACFGAGLAALSLSGVKGWMLRGLCVVCGAGLACVAVATETRGVLMAVLIGGAWLAWKESKTHTIIAVVPVAVLSALYLPERFSFQAESEHGRIAIWNERLLDIASNPWGFGSRYIDAYGVTCHSTYIEIAYMYGWLPSMGFLLAVVATAFRCLKSEAWIVACFAAVSLHAFTDSHILSAPIVFWMQMMIMGAIWK